MFRGVQSLIPAPSVPQNSQHTGRLLPARPAWPFPDPPPTRRFRDRKFFASNWDLPQCCLGPVIKVRLKSVLGTSDPQGLALDMPGKDAQILLIQQGAGTGPGVGLGCCC